MKSFTFYPSGESFGIVYDDILIMAILWNGENYILSSDYTTRYDVRIIGVDEV
jgi:hypothetical protein